MTIEIEYPTLMNGAKSGIFTKVRGWKKEKRRGLVITFETGEWWVFPMNSKIKIIQGNLF